MTAEMLSTDRVIARVAASKTLDETLEQYAEGRISAEDVVRKVLQLCERVLTRRGDTDTL